ncbi:MAG TPA: thiol peroxidase [Desulfurivibrionaceae bacterium]|nr:thiol peroxidase [Desulfurivibrionaceae bacterium]
MAQITLGGEVIHTIGSLPQTGTMAPDFLLTRSDLSDVGLGDFRGTRVVLNIFPSIDTSICAMSVRRFNAEINACANAVCLCVSRDLPFAHARFCGAEGLTNVVTLSELRNRDFGDQYGVRIMDGPLAGLLARAVVVIDTDGCVLYGELVPEIKQEPDYAAALRLLR